MSRLRKGKKYKGAGFADNFKSAITMKSPLYEVAIAGDSPEVEKSGTLETETPTTEVEKNTDELEKSSASQATIDNLTDQDIVPKRTSSRSLSSREQWKEDSANKKKKAAEDKAAEEAAAEEALEAKRYRSEDGELVFEDDYVEGSKGKDRRKEHRENKGKVKDEFKADKARLKAMRDSGEISKKEYKQMLKGEKGEKKGLKKASKTLKKRNKSDTKAAKKKAKRAKKGK